MFLSSLLLKQGRNCAIVYWRDEKNLPTGLFRVTVHVFRTKPWSIRLRITWVKMLLERKKWLLPYIRTREQGKTPALPLTRILLGGQVTTEHYVSVHSPVWGSSWAIRPVAHSTFRMNHYTFRSKLFLNVGRWMIRHAFRTATIDLSAYTSSASWDSKYTGQFWNHCKCLNWSAIIVKSDLHKVHRNASNQKQCRASG